MRVAFTLAIATTLIACNIACCVDAGVIKNIFNKLKNNDKQQTPNRGENIDLSIPLCGNKLFSSSQSSISPEIIFITKARTNSAYVDTNNRIDRRRSQRETNGRRNSINPVTQEFRFHAENVTLNELLQYGFNPDAPVSFLIHGFTSGYPLQSWITAMVEAYTIDETKGVSSSGLRPPFANNHEYDNEPEHEHDNSGDHALEGHQHQGETHIIHRRQSLYNKPNANIVVNNNNNRQQFNYKQQANLVSHNLFIVNWHYASRGPILYPRAVANIVPVSKFISTFINRRLIEEARIPAHRIQLVGHSLGAHLAGFIGKATTRKVGRIFGLDPAGPCFGQITGSLYPTESRLAPDDAEEVVSIHTDYELLGLEAPVGKYSVYIEGGKKQPGCTALTKLAVESISPDGPDFDKIACSHSRAPNLLSLQLASHHDECMMVAYECDSWDNFKLGFCGFCDKVVDASAKLTESGPDSSRFRPNRRPTSPVECVRIGLEWQYKQNKNNYPARNKEFLGHSDEMYSGIEVGNVVDDFPTGNNYDAVVINGRQKRNAAASQSNSTIEAPLEPTTTTSSPVSGSSASTPAKPYFNSTKLEPKLLLLDKKPLVLVNETITQRKVSTNDSFSLPLPRIIGKGITSIVGEKVDKRVKKLFMRTSNTQPYCTFHYQVVLELSEPFSGGRKPPMALVLQDARQESHSSRRSDNQRGNSQSSTSVTSDDFGNKFDDKTYTHLLTSSKRLNKVQHASLIFRNGLPQSDWQKLRSVTVNYMSHVDSRERHRLSSTLCLTTSSTDQNDANSQLAGRRFYFQPCNDQQGNNNQQNYNQQNYNQQIHNQQNYNQQNYNQQNYNSQRNNNRQRQQNQRPRFARENERDRVVFGDSNWQVGWL